MEKTQFLSEEAKKKIAELQSEISIAKKKIKESLRNDLGINYIVWADSGIYERMDFSKSLDVIYPYLEVIKNCYACMDEIFKKSIETEKYNKENREPMQTACQSNEAKQNAAKNAAKKAFNEIIEHMKSHRMTVFKMDYEDEEQIKIGDRVKLKGDSNSPEMTVIGNISNDARHQIGKSITEATIQGNDFLKCAWFPESREDNEVVLSFSMQTLEIHKDALEKVTK